jgi:hypothetical protein
MIDRSEIAQSAGTFERFEKVTRVDFGMAVIRVVLEKFVAGFRVTEATQDAEFGEV